MTIKVLSNSYKFLVLFIYMIKTLKVPLLHLYIDISSNEIILNKFCCHRISSIELTIS